MFSIPRRIHVHWCPKLQSSDMSVEKSCAGRTSSVGAASRANRHPHLCTSIVGSHMPGSMMSCSSLPQPWRSYRAGPIAGLRLQACYVEAPSDQPLVVPLPVDDRPVIQIIRLAILPIVIELVRNCVLIQLDP